jgi:alpha-beta hydrolase superfamily lysophospholipase
MTAEDFEFDGARGRISGRSWPCDAARYVAVLVHGYGEHIGRYEHVADRLVRHGAAVYGLDHVGHGRSAGDRALIDDFGPVVADLHAVVERARAQQPDLPVVLVGHSMGGLVATLYAQQHTDVLTALVLSGPAIGVNPALAFLFEMEEIPDIPVDPAILSRDPEVGRRYAEDELVYHGPFKKATLLAMAAAMQQIADGPTVGDLPVLWLHGEQDQLAPLEVARPVVERVAGDRLEHHAYPGAQHEIFNETNQDDVLNDVTAFVDHVLEPARQPS